MSHEIRTPLNGVVAMAEMLTRAGLEPKAKEMAGIIHASGETLLRLLNDILDLSRIESGKITLEAVPFHLGDAVRAVVGLSDLKCQEKGLTLQVEISEAVDHWVTGDAVRVRQVVTNLLSNAVKFTDHGDVALRVDRTDDNQVRFLVCDSGVGFPMTDKAKVLGRFEQADSSITRRFGGTGLGLSICCELAVLMGGILDCSSAPGVGSEFWMTIPLGASSPPIEAVDSGASDGRDFGADHIRVLLADDHPTNRRVVEMMLDGVEADLSSVENGAQAVDLYQIETFDIVLMDMQMPVMDGLSAIRAIRSIEIEKGLPRVPIIMLTANALPEHITSARLAGADLHLSKPFTAPELFAALDRGLSQLDVETMAA